MNKTPKALKIFTLLPTTEEIRVKLKGAKGSRRIDILQYPLLLTYYNICQQSGIFKSDSPVITAYGIFNGAGVLQKLRLNIVEMFHKKNACCIVSIWWFVKIHVKAITMYNY